MEYEFALPDVAEGLVEAEIMRWLVAVGDVVEADQSVVEVETAKALVEIPTPVAGTVGRLGAEEGQVLQVGQTLITVEIPDDAGSPSDDRASRGVERTPVTPAASTPASEAGKRRALASPSTRRAARALGVDLGSLVGTGPRGRVTRSDMEAAAAGRAPSSDAAPGCSPASGSAGAPVRKDTQDEVVSLRGVRRTVAESMSRSWREIPHITEFREIDATGLVAARRALAVDYDDPAAGRHLTFLPLMVAACTRALRRHREFNASVDLEGQQITYRASIDIGIATSTDEGLIVPVLTATQSLSLFEIADRVAELTELTRTRRARPDQLTGGTFTITNFGSYGTWLGTPVINPPQSAIAGFGRIQDRPAVSEGEVVVRKTLPIVLAADHRVIDGRSLGGFMDDLERYLTDPVVLLGGER